MYACVDIGRGLCRRSGGFAHIRLLAETCRKGDKKKMIGSAVHVGVCNG